MLKRFYILLLSALCLLNTDLYSQELNAQVQVLTSNIQATNKQIYTTLETSISQFLNTRKWTDENYEPNERISCQFILNITDRQNDQFSGDLQISYSRPVYKSDYNSPVLVLRDDNLQFQYLEFDRLDFTLNSNLSNLTSILGYYVYIILGMDHDTFSPKGGDPFYSNAQQIVGNAQGSQYGGWTAFDGNRNRFILVDNLTSPAFDNLRLGLYNYHRLGLDKMHDPNQQQTAKEVIKKSLIDLKVVNDKRRSSYLMQVFFDAKSQEIINIFNGGAPIQLADLKEVLSEIDPSNSGKYEQMGKA